MMIVLVNSPAMLPGREVVPPLGLLKVAAIPDREGYEVKILDGNILKMDDLRKKILKCDPEFVGFTSFTGPMLKYCLELSKFAKENTNAKVTWGGVHASLLSHQIIQEDSVDIVVLREGDYTLFDIIKNPHSLDKVKGIMYKENGKIQATEGCGLIKDLDKLPITPWHLIDANKYLASWADAKKTLPLLTSRGCPYHCGFCYNNKFNDRKWRSYSLEKVREEVDLLVSQYPIDGVRVMNDNFIGLDSKKAVEIAEYLNEKDLLWSCLLRVNQVNREILQKFRDTDCNYIFYGIESGSPRILKFIKKYITLEQIKKIVKITNELKIRTAAGFMYDFPTETLEDVKATFKLIDKLGIYVALTAFQPFPGTELFDYCVENKLLNLPKTTIEWAEFKYTKAHGVSNIPRDKIEGYSKRWNLKYNYFYNIKLALKKGDFSMLMSMGRHFMESFIRDSESA